MSVEQERNLEVTLSTGVSTCPANASEAKELIAKADDALYKAKENGRECVVKAQSE